MPDALSLPYQTGPLAVSIAYLLLYYATVWNIARTRNRLHREYRSREERFDRYFGQDREMLAADRIQLNLLEHMPPFLALLWLHAVFVGPTGATIGGAIYVAARSYYPFVMGTRLGRDMRMPILFSTAPGYLVQAYFLLALSAAALGLLPSSG